nr:hypothetical protein [Angustibacter aerolatus]
MRYVAVVGPGDAADGDLVVAHDVGRLLAERGTVVLTGGLGGVMEAAARGAARAGGTSVGLLPGSDRRGANPHSTLTLPTGLGEPAQRGAGARRRRRGRRGRFVGHAQRGRARGALGHAGRAGRWLAGARRRRPAGRATPRGHRRGRRPHPAR